MRVRKKFIIDYIKFHKFRNVFSINYKTEFEFVSLKENEDITTQMEIFFPWENNLCLSARNKTQLEQPPFLNLITATGKVCSFQ